MIGDFNNRRRCGKKLVIFLCDVVFWYLPEGPDKKSGKPLKDTPH